MPPKSHYDHMEADPRYASTTPQPTNIWEQASKRIEDYYRPPPLTKAEIKYFQDEEAKWQQKEAFENTVTKPFQRAVNTYNDQQLRRSIQNDMAKDEYGVFWGPQDISDANYRVFGKGLGYMQNEVKNWKEWDAVKGGVKALGEYAIGTRPLIDVPAARQARDELLQGNDWLELARRAGYIK